MRICVNIEKDSIPRLIEEDVEIALSKLHGLALYEWDITEHEGGTITADTGAPLRQIGGNLEGMLAKAIKDATGAVVEVEIIEGFPPPGWAP